MPQTVTVNTGGAGETTINLPEEGQTFRAVGNEFDVFQIQ